MIPLGLDQETWSLVVIASLLAGLVAWRLSPEGSWFRRAVDCLLGVGPDPPG